MPGISQLGDAILLKSMRGVWELREYAADGTLAATGTLTFRGADSSPDKGQVKLCLCFRLLLRRCLLTIHPAVCSHSALRSQVAYAGEAAGGRGPWILKSDGFGRRRALRPS
jgi:hypothetical protein